MATIAVSQVVPAVRPPALPARAPDFLGMLHQQATMLLGLATTVGEVLQGRESAHALRLLDLEQRREELQRRNQAAVNSAEQRYPGLDQIHRTMETLDRAAAGLFGAARSFGQAAAQTDAATSGMMVFIRRATESLQQGYARLAEGTPVDFDAAAAMNSRSAQSRCGRLGGDEVLAPEGQPLAAQEEQFTTLPEGSSRARILCLCALYRSLSDIATELTGAEAILRQWSRQLSGSSLYDLAGGVRPFALPSQQQLVAN